MDRYDALCVREYTDNHGETKTSWTRVGVAFKARQGDGYTLFLDAMPASVDGQYKIMLRPPRPRGSEGNQTPDDSLGI
jgi:hypothetical protein